MYLFYEVNINLHNKPSTQRKVAYVFFSMESELTVPPLNSFSSEFHTVVYPIKLSQNFQLSLYKLRLKKLQ